MSEAEQLTRRPSGLGEHATVLDAVSAHLKELQATIAGPVRIRAEDLASQLGVSRTPVREALIKLESSGLISLRPGRGALLQPVSDGEYLEWLKLREPLEGLAAREAALNASKHDVEELKGLFAPFPNEAAIEAKQAEYAQANVSFHEALMRLGANRLLEHVWASFGHRQTTYRRQTISRLHRGGDSLREHLAVIDAIEKRDPDLAEMRAREHVRTLRVAFEAKVIRKSAA